MHKIHSLHNIYIRIVGFITAAALITAFGISLYAYAADTGTGYTYVSIGDSFTGGKNLSDPASQCYSAAVARGLNADLTEYAVNGMTSHDLILALTSGYYTQKLKLAHIITVSVGMSELVSDFSSVIDGVLSEYSLNLTDMLYDLKNSPAAVNAKYESAVNAVNETLKDNADLADTSRAFAKRIATVTSLIHKIMPNCMTYFIELYNPFKNTVPLSAGKAKLNISSLFLPYVETMNKAFEDFGSYIGIIKTNQYIKAENLAQYGNGWDGNILTPPLPNVAAHNKIAEEIVSAAKIPVVSDINGHWGEEYIKRVLCWGVYDGIITDRFAPDESMTRARFVTILARTMNANVSKYNVTPFSDIDMNMYYAQSVTWAAFAKIVHGNGSNKFNPNNPITREEMAVMLGRLIKEYAVPIPKLQAKAAFSDEDKISDWAKDDIIKLSQSGLMLGNNGNEFNPKSQITNAEVATIICRINEAAELFCYLG